MSEERQRVFWFQDGNSHSGDVIGSFLLSFETEDDIDLVNQNSTFRSMIGDPNGNLLEGKVDFTHTLDSIIGLEWNHRKILVVTGCQMVPEDLTASTKEDAFKMYTERLAAKHGLMV